MEIYIGSSYNKRAIKAFIRKVPPEYFDRIKNIYFYNRTPYSTRNVKQWRHLNGYIHGAYTPKHQVIEIFCKGKDINHVLNIFAHEIGHAVCGSSERAAENFGQLLRRYVNEL